MLFDPCGQPIVCQAGSMAQSSGTCWLQWRRLQGRQSYARTPIMVARVNDPVELVAESASAMGHNPLVQGIYSLPTCSILESTRS